MMRENNVANKFRQSKNQRPIYNPIYNYFIAG